MMERINLNKSFSDDDDDDIIELTDILYDALDNGDDDHGLSGIELPEHGAATADERDEAIKEGFNKKNDDEMDKAVEAALSRIIEKRYAQKLDTLFVEAVERVVEKEILAIKRSLLKEL